MRMLGNVGTGGSVDVRAHVLCYDTPLHMPMRMLGHISTGGSADVRARL